MTRLPTVQFLLTAAAVLPILTAIVAAQQTVQTGRVTLVVGDVSFAVPGRANFAKLQPGATLAVGSTVKTGDKSRAVILTSRQSAIRVGANSTVVLAEMTAPQGETKAKVKIDVSLSKISK